MHKHSAAQPKKSSLPAFLPWAAGLFAVLAGGAALVYYWRVFYSYGQYPFAHIPAAALTALVCGVLVCGLAAAWAVRRFVKSFCAKAAAAIFCVGLLFVFVNPPLQAPDEHSHFLRAYSMAQGHFDFDGARQYPDDVSALMASFGVAWTNAHDGSTIKARTETPMENPAPADTVSGECITEGYVRYAQLLQSGEAAALPKTTEPYLFVLLPLIPQAVGIAVARLLGYSALGALYGGRVANLLFYTFLCWAALKNCKRYRGVFLACMLLPLSLFLAASCSYDGMILGLYFFAASYYCKDEITDRDLWLFGIAYFVMCSAKINNVLWILLPLVLPKKAWRARLKKWQAALAVVGAFAVCNAALAAYVAAVRYNLPDIGRTILEADAMAQLQFMLQNPLRTAAVFLGTLYENDFFLFRMGVFGSTDLAIPVLNTLSALSLCLGAALSVHEKSSLTPRSAVGLFVLAAAYIVSVMAGLYLTYTPVAMVRVVGLQARYFLPAFLMLFVLLAALLSHVLEVKPAALSQRAQTLSLAACTLFGVYGALLLFQHYFVGPVTVSALG